MIYLSQDAKQQGKKEANSHRLWFRDKYGLAPTDPRYLAMTDEGIEAEYWAYQYQADKVSDEIEEDYDFDMAAEVARIEAEAERNRPTPVVDDWEDVDA